MDHKWFYTQTKVAPRYRGTKECILRCIYQKRYPPWRQAPKFATLASLKLCNNKRTAAPYNHCLVSNVICWNYMVSGNSDPVSDHRRKHETWILLFPTTSFQYSATIIGSGCTVENHCQNASHIIQNTPQMINGDSVVFNMFILKTTPRAISTSH